MSLSDLEIDELSDKDNIIGSLEETFSCPYHLSNTTSLGNSYILHVDANSDNSRYLAAQSDKNVKILDPGLTIASVLSPHAQAVTGAAFSKTDVNQLFTSSTDGTIRLWDLRTPKRHCLEYRDTTDRTKHEGPPSKPDKPILSFDTSSDSRVICGGTEQVGQDSYLLFWDTRSGNLMGGYWESHEDDVTCIRFHPTEKDCMSSGSTDGLVNIFDLSQGKEDDAIVTCHNTEDSVSNIHWFSKKDRLRYVAISTHTESLQLWDTDEFQPYQSFTRADVAHGIRRTGAEHTYIVNAHAQEDQGFLLLAGSRYAADPCLRLATLKNKKLKPVADLRAEKGGQGLVRDSAQLNAFSGFITGSESGVVSVWRPGVKPTTHLPESTSLKMKNKHSKSREKPY